MATRRQRDLARALRALAPHISFAEAQEVLARASAGSLKHLTATAAAWLALTSHVRHQHTEYDALLSEGYDRDAARHFVRDAMEEQLALWGCARTLSDEEDS